MKLKKKDTTVMTLAKNEVCVGQLHENFYLIGGLTFVGVEPKTW